jgi:endonuclease YncB( thermonuclease family)
MKILNAMFAAVVFALALAFTSMIALAGQAPPPGSGSFDIAGPVRVIDGDTLEVYIEGRRVGVGLIGVDAPLGNTACGRRATEMLRQLTSERIDLEEDLALSFDARHRRLYYVSAPRSASVAFDLVAAGLARPNGLGREQAALATAAAQARASGAGCVWTGGA